MNLHSKEYKLRFSKNYLYRQKVWKIITTFMQQFIPKNSTVLDLGAGWCEFINNIDAKNKIALDLNPDIFKMANRDITVTQQSSTIEWNINKPKIDVIFTSNFLEHLKNRDDIEKTLFYAHKNLKPNGLMILIGPNIKYTHGSYWDFWDHYIPLTEKSISEVLSLTNFKIIKCIPKFLPYTMSNSINPPSFLLKIYLRFPFLWKFFGQQFLIIAQKIK